MADHTDNWGAMTALLRELGPTARLLDDNPMTQEGARAYVRWIFAALETFTYCLKRITVEQVARESTALSAREQDVLAMVKEPVFPGLPPPRRIGMGMRESFAVAVNVYARTRSKESPLEDGRVPEIFIEASSLHDRLSHPESPDDLQLTKADLTAVGEFLKWFVSVRNWLYNDYADQIEEMKTKMNASCDELRRKLERNEKDPSSA